MPNILCNKIQSQAFIDLCTTEKKSVKKQIQLENNMSREQSIPCSLKTPIKTQQFRRYFFLFRSFSQFLSFVANFICFVFVFNGVCVYRRQVAFPFIRQYRKKTE